MPTAVIYKEISEFLDISYQKMETEIKLGNGTIGKAVKSNSKIKPLILERLKTLYPKALPIILKHERDEAGEIGNYVITDAEEYSKGGNEFVSMGSGRYLMLIPLVHEYAYGGYQTGFSDVTFIESLPKHPIVVEEKHKGTYRAFVVKGDSMSNDTSDSIDAGDIVIGRKIEKHLWSLNKLHLHKFKEFVIHTVHGILIKQIIAHDPEMGTVTISSYNPEYPVSTIAVDDIVELFNVVQVNKTR